MAKGQGKGRDSETLTYVACGCFVIWVIIAIFLIAFSFSKLDANEVGLDYNRNTQRIDFTQAHSQGLKFLGVGHGFIKFDTTIINIDMTSDPIRARTLDGLVVSLQTRLLYRINTDVNALANTYLNFEDRHEDVIKSVARATIRDVAAQYSAFSFWTIRDQIGAAMQQALTPVLADLQAQVTTFTLINLSLPPAFQDAIDETDGRRQEFEAVAFAASSANITKQTRIDQAQQVVIAIGNEANATAESFLLDVDARIFSLENRINAEIDQFKLLKDELNFTNDELAAFVWLDTMDYWAQDTKKTYSLTTPTSLHP